MKRLARVAAAIGFGVCLAALPLSALAADLRQGNDVTVGGGQTINDDLYAAGGTISVNGTVNGSLIVAAGNVSVAGTVRQDVMVAGGSVTINGKIGGSVRAAGGNVTVNGPVGQDLVVAGGTITVGSGGSIGRDLVLTAGNASDDAPVARNVVVRSGTLTIRKLVGFNVTGRVDHLTLDGAMVAGNLDYTSGDEVQLINGARVAGTTTRHQPPASNAGNNFLNWLRALVGIVAFGLIFLFLFPRLSGRSIDMLRAEPWVSLGIGAAILLVTPIVALLLFIIGIFIGGWWIAVLGMAIWLLVLITGYVVSAFLVGRMGFAQLGWGSYHDALALAAGLLVLAILTVIPYIGWLIGLAAVVFGAGAFGLSVTAWGRRLRGASAI